MKENYIRTVVKEPGKAPCVFEFFLNNLREFQRAVDGNIELIQVTEDMSLLVNEEAIIYGLPFNIEFLGLKLFGTIIAVGTCGEEFVSLSMEDARFIQEQLSMADNK